jgi:hypothetical protein
MRPCPVVPQRIRLERFVLQCPSPTKLIRAHGRGNSHLSCE